jgi:hypothetical protein
MYRNLAICGNLALKVAPLLAPRLAPRATLKVPLIGFFGKHQFVFVAGWYRSTPTEWHPSCAAAVNVVPDPTNGSRTQSPGLADNGIHRSGNSNGNGA